MNKRARRQELVISGATPPATSLLSIWSLPCGPLTDLEYAPGGFVESEPSPTRASPSSCGPPSWSATWDSTGGLVIAYYSPAICPIGYTVACSWYGTQQGPTPDVTETAMNCLPSGYKCTSTYLIDGEADGVSVHNPHDLAPMIPIRWAGDELYILETHPLTPGLFMSTAVRATTDTAKSFATATVDFYATATTDSFATQTSTGSAPPANSAPGSSISTGAIAGIAVGAVIGVLLFIAAAILVMWKRRASTFAPRGDALEDFDGKPELDGKVLSRDGAHEIDSDRPTLLVEAPGWTAKHELGSGKPEAELLYDGRAELPANETVQPSSAVPGQLSMDRSANEDNDAPLTAVDKTPIPIDELVSASWTDSLSAPATSSEQSTNTEGDELARLQKRQTRIEEKRQRLVELQQLDEEEETVRKRIALLEQR